MTEKQMKQVISAIESQRGAASDAIASASAALYPTMKYGGGLITAGARINWNGVLRRAAADLWDTEQNSPGAAPNLWEDIDYYMGYRIIPEIITAGLAFNAGEIGYWPENGKFYRAVNDATVWNPASYPAVWMEMTT